MKVLLYLNGPIGWQTGIEDGFQSLKSNNEIEDVQFVYFEQFKTSKNNKIEDILFDHAINFSPNFIAFFHISNLPITGKLLNKLKKLPSKPIIVYDEGDMYGSWAKPITNTMKDVISKSDVVSLRGLGVFARLISKYNRNIIYTPHHADIARFDKEPFILKERSRKMVLIGNKIQSKYLNLVRRLPGASDRELFVKYMGEKFSNEFNVYGNGWEGFVGNKGAVPFQEQMEVYRDSWITFAYEHYPEVSYYFSNRLPIALMAGSLYVCHYHHGYEQIFKNCDFIFFFKKNNEVEDIIRYIFSLDKKDLLARSERAREFSLKYFTPEVVWRNFYYNSLNSINYE